MPHTIIRNKSQNPVQCRVSENDTLGGNGATWHQIASNASIELDRNAWELITFRNVADTERGGSCVDLRAAKLVEFHEFTKFLVF